MSKKSPNIDLIVAKYKEDTSWCQKFGENCKILIYDKGNPSTALSLPNIPRFPRNEFRGSFHAKTPTGRESHTYLYHILKNYPHFADFNFFCQGRVEDHIPLFEDIFNYLITVESRPCFLHLGKAELCDVFGGPYHRGLPLSRVYQRLFKGPVPENFLFHLSATFWVSKESILSRPKRFYEEMMQIIYEEPLSGYVFERFWEYVLHAPYLESQTWNNNPKRNSWNLDL